MTTWFPDTCPCELTIEDDTNSPNWAKTIAHINVCADHSRLAYGHADVLAENQRKNLASADAEAAHPNAAFSWSFDADRVLVLTFDPAGPNAPNAAAKTALQTRLEATYGAGKVRVA